MRLDDPRHWIRTWEVGGMNAGIEGAGADEAWWETSLVLEHCRIKGIPFAGGASDIYKRFDQLPRELVYHLALVAGMPQEILTAYASFQEKLTVRNNSLPWTKQWSDRGWGEHGGFNGFPRAPQEPCGNTLINLHRIWFCETSEF